MLRPGIAHYNTPASVLTYKIIAVTVCAATSHVQITQHKQWFNSECAAALEATTWQAFGLLDYTRYLRFRLSHGLPLYIELTTLLTRHTEALPFPALYWATASSARRTLSFTLVCFACYISLSKEINDATGAHHPGQCTYIILILLHTTRQLLTDYEDRRSMNSSSKMGWKCNGIAYL